MTFLAGSSRLRIVWVLPLAVSLGFVLGAEPACAESPGDPASILSREFGLSRLGKGEVWITRRERDIRLRLDDVRALVGRGRAGAEAIAKVQANNLALWSQRQALEQTIRKNAQSSTSESRKQLEEELKKLDAIAVAPEKLGGAPWVQPQLKEVANTLSAILLGVFTTRRDVEQLGDEYAGLARQEEVKAALTELGGDARLGPLRDYRSAAPALEECEQFVFSQPHPLYFESGQMRIGAILNDQTPVTWTWREGSDPAVITAGIAQLAGIEPEPKAPQRTIACPGGRQLAARRVTLSSVRFGQHVLRDVEAYVLPPEGEDCGAQIGASAFSGFSVAPEPAQLRIRIEPR